MDKETKKPDVVIGKSALDEFLEEWSSWRGKRNGKKIAATIRRRQAEENMPTAERIKMKRKRQRTNFMDSGFMVVIGFFVGLVEFFFSIVMWLFSFVFSFKFWAIVGVIIYFSDVEIEDIGKVLDDLNVKEAIEKVEEGAKGIMELTLRRKMEPYTNLAMMLMCGAKKASVRGQSSEEKPSKTSKTF